MSHTSDLIAVLDTFLEAAADSGKERRNRHIERQLERDLSDAFLTQGRRFVKAFQATKYLLQESISPSDWLGIFINVSAGTMRLFADPLERAAAAAMASGAAALVAEIGAALSFDLANPRAVAYLEQHGADLVKGIDETTRDQLQTIISQGASEGWSHQKISQAIIAKYSDFAVGRPQAHIHSRAHLIAVTEVGNAYEQGADIVARDLQGRGVQLEKKWAGPRDDRTSSDCLGNMDEGWIDFDKAFSSGKHRPLNHPGCRHTLLTRRKRGERAAAVVPEAVAEKYPKFPSIAKSQDWAEKNFNEWREGLDFQQESVLGAFKGGKSRDVNGYLRGLDIEGVNPKYSEHLVKVLDSSFENPGAVVNQNITVWRGMRNDLIRDLQGNRPIESLEGLMIKDKGFAATSLSRNVAEVNYGMNGVVAEIRVPAGTKAVYLDMPGFHNYDYQEYELLLNRESTFKIVSAIKDGNTTRLILEVVP